MAEVNMAQIERVAKVLKNMPESGHGMNFYSFPGKDGKEIVADDMYPALNHPQAINFFFFTSLQNFGFWYGDDFGYVEPLYGTMSGKQTKGAELLFKACKNALDKDETIFEPERLAKIRPTELARIFSDDNGPIPFPDFEERFRMTRAYGKYFVDYPKHMPHLASPEGLVDSANGSKLSLASFLVLMSKVRGYDLDMLHKRQLLLAMELANRPEKFLKVDDSKHWAPIVDYHLMRINLRLGTVVPNPHELYPLESRKWVSAEMESDVRRKTRDAVKKLMELSGKSMSFIDEKLWMARRYCPEMEKPDCPNCVFSEVCEKKIEFFQPIFRTTAY